MYASSDFLPLSALQHLLYCERQAALIHVNQVWADNVLTVQGTQLHESVDTGREENRGDLRIRRSVWLRSERLGLVGKADVIEFRRVESGDGVPLTGVDGVWRPVPVEYKRGKPKAHRADEVQLCAQAMCLEETMGLPIPRGTLFYGARRRRTDVELTAELRELVEGAARRLHEIIDSGVVPIRHRHAGCDRCSLLEVCMPPASDLSARAYLARAIAEDA